MTAGKRLSICLLAVAVVAAGLLVWLQWPFGGPDPGVQARLQRIERLHATVEREMADLESMRERRAMTDEELRSLRESLSERRRDIERFERELEKAQDGD